MLLYTHRGPVCSTSRNSGTISSYTAQSCSPDSCGATFTMKTSPKYRRWSPSSTPLIQAGTEGFSAEHRRPWTRRRNTLPCKMNAAVAEQTCAGEEDVVAGDKVVLGDY